MGYADTWMQEAACQALQEAAAMYMVQLFKDSNLCVIHTLWATIQLKDIQLARETRGLTVMITKEGQVNSAFIRYPGP